MSSHKAILCWSGGKDSAYCLHEVLLENVYEVRYLLTTVNGEFKRISMHGVREELLDKQAESIGIPLLKVNVTEGSNVEYERQMETVLLKAKAEGINHVIFGDIFLEEVRNYRENNLARVGMTAVFPLWKKDTTGLIKDFIDRKFKTIICCTNDGYLEKTWLGREIDESFLDDLPSGVDPCGENGEYHSFCYDGPIYEKEIGFIPGEMVYKSLEIKTETHGDFPDKLITKGFWFYDLVPK